MSKVMCLLPQAVAVLNWLRLYGVPARPAIPANGGEITYAVEGAAIAYYFVSPYGHYTGGPPGPADYWRQAFTGGESNYWIDATGRTWLWGAVSWTHPPTLSPYELFAARWDAGSNQLVPMFDIPASVNVIFPADPGLAWGGLQSVCSDGSSGYYIVTPLLTGSAQRFWPVLMHWDGTAAQATSTTTDHAQWARSTDTLSYPGDFGMPLVPTYYLYEYEPGHVRTQGYDPIPGGTRLFDPHATHVPLANVYWHNIFRQDGTYYGLVDYRYTYALDGSNVPIVQQCWSWITCTGSDPTDAGAWEMGYQLIGPYNMTALPSDPEFNFPFTLSATPYEPRQYGALWTQAYGALIFVVFPITIWEGTAWTYRAYVPIVGVVDSGNLLTVLEIPPTYTIPTNGVLDTESGQLTVYADTLYFSYLEYFKTTVGTSLVTLHLLAWDTGLYEFVPVTDYVAPLSDWGYTARTTACWGTDGMLCWINPNDFSSGDRIIRYHLDTTTWDHSLLTGTGGPAYGEKIFYDGPPPP